MRLEFVGQTSDPMAKEWDRYLAAARDNLMTSWNGALRAYRSLRDVRQGLNLPLVAPTGEAQSVGALSAGQAQSMLELGALVDTSRRALDEAIAGKRKVGFDAAMSTLQIERLPTDANRIETRGGVPVLIDNSTGNPARITGTIDGLPGTLGIAPIVWVGLAVAAVAVTVSQVYAVVKVCETTQEVMHEKTLQTIANNAHEQIMSGKATPDQAKAQAESILKGEAELKRAAAEQASSAGLTPDTNKTIRTVAIVAAIGGVLYLISKVVPNREPRIVPA